MYVETSVRNKCRCSFYCALLTLSLRFLSLLFPSPEFVSKALRSVCITRQHGVMACVINLRTDQVFCSGNASEV
jgi:hypothetical protein